MAVCRRSSSIYSVCDLHDRGVLTDPKDPDSDFDLHTTQVLQYSSYALLIPNL